MLLAQTDHYDLVEYSGVMMILDNLGNIKACGFSLMSEALERLQVLELPYCKERLPKNYISWESKGVY